MRIWLYLLNQVLLRMLMMGIDVIVIDPENEYRPLVDTVGWSYLDVSLNSNERINPFDLPMGMKDHDEKPGDLLRSAVINLLGLMNLLLGQISCHTYGKIYFRYICMNILKAYKYRSERGLTGIFSSWPRWCTTSNDYVYHTQLYLEYGTK